MASVDMVVATGGAGMVKAAYSSGTPAYGVGAGNATVIIDETADIADAAHKVFLGKTFDNATSCSSENSLVVQRHVYDAVVAALEGEGAYLCTAAERERLRQLMWKEGVLNRRIVAQPAARIAELAGIDLPAGVRMLMVEGRARDGSDPFAGEKLSVVLTLWRYGEFSEAVDHVREITGFSGYGHSCGIHTRCEDRVRELALRAPVSRIMVRQPQSYANSGNYDNGMPFSLTLGCGSWGGNITTENITYKHFLNTTWVASPIEPVVPNEDAIFGAYWEFLDTAAARTKRRDS
jgi:sulfoacetaldehyde dehydrogenase